VGRELPHHQEQRDHDEVVVGEPRVREVLERVEQRRRIARQVEVATGAAGEHRDADRHPEHHQRQHDGEDRAAERDAAHSLIL
jgi:hypothetical protein